MADLAGTETHANLLAAFARESEANRRYLWFAQQADVEGRPHAATLFRSLAESETGHAHGHLEFLADVGDPTTGLAIGDTDDNLAASLAAEIHESAQMYPNFAATARAEGFGDIADWLDTVARSERVHADRLSDHIDTSNAGD